MRQYQAAKQDIMQELIAHDPDNAGWRRDLSVAHNCVGGVLQAQGRLQEALAEYEAYKRIMQELTARDPDNAGWRRELSVSHNYVGGVLQAQGRLQEALAEYEAAQADHAGADRARSGQCRLAARSFGRRTTASAGSFRRRAGCRRRWRSTRPTSGSCRS